MTATEDTGNTEKNRKMGIFVVIAVVALLVQLRRNRATG